MSRLNRLARTHWWVLLVVVTLVSAASLLAGAATDRERSGRTGTTDNARSSSGVPSPGVTSAHPSLPRVSNDPPPEAGYFPLQPVGSWSSVPDNQVCAGQVHRSTWEPRPDNDKRNHVTPDAEAVHRAFAARPVSPDGTHDRRWDSWLLKRVDGQFTGTTDEIFQWAACKWGLSDNLLRAVAVRESTWYQYETYSSGRPVANFGSGDMMPPGTDGADVYCDGIAQHGYDYQRDFDRGICPQTFSIVGVKSWQSPNWGVMPGNQNGTFPFDRDSTAFAVDYVASQIRGCFEGWASWLGTTGTRPYTSGDVWGCVGAWYSGDWYGSETTDYVSGVRRALDDRTWLTPIWPSVKPGCDPTYGCPVPDPL